MKKIFIFAIAMISTFMFGACTNTASQNNNEVESDIFSVDSICTVDNISADSVVISDVVAD